MLDLICLASFPDPTQLSIIAVWKKGLRSLVCTFGEGLGTRLTSALISYMYIPGAYVY